LTSGLLDDGNLGSRRVLVAYRAALGAEPDDREVTGHWESQLCCQAAYASVGGTTVQMHSSRSSAHMTPTFTAKVTGISWISVPIRRSATCHCENSTHYRGVPQSKLAEPHNRSQAEAGQFDGNIIGDGAPMMLPSDTNGGVHLLASALEPPDRKLGKLHRVKFSARWPSWGEGG
jgi:hypothetical protein